MPRIEVERCRADHFRRPTSVWRPTVSDSEAESEVVAPQTSMAEMLSGAAGAAFGLLDAVRSLYAATGFGIESLGGLVEVIRRLAAGDFHPAIVWPIYAADTPDKLALVET